MHMIIDQNMINISQMLDGLYKYFNFAKTIARKFVRRKQDWGIGIYVGKTLFDFKSPVNINNPVLTAKHVTDVPADFVADPFMICDNGIWYMFFEVLNACNQKGEIGLATSNDGFDWKYKQIVLNEPFHLSYPYVFKWKNDYYMIPESYQANSVRLYKAEKFPTQWSFVKTLLNGLDYVDSSIFYFNGNWWLFSTSYKNNTLRLYYADELMGNWTEHPQSPVVERNIKISRSAGRVVVMDGKIIRYTQDGEHCYGNLVRAFQITEITQKNYQEEVKVNPVLKATGTGWNARGMHNIDPHQIDKNKWIACVDGYRISLVLGRGY